MGSGKIGGSGEKWMSKIEGKERDRRGRRQGNPGGKKRFKNCVEDGHVFRQNFLNNCVERLLQENQVRKFHSQAR